MNSTNIRVIFLYDYKTGINVAKDGDFTEYDRKAKSWLNKVGSLLIGFYVNASNFFYGISSTKLKI